MGVRVGYRDRISSQLHTISEHEVAEYPGPALNAALNTPGAGSSSSTRPTPNPGAVVDPHGGAEAPSLLLPDSPKRRGRKRKGNTDGNRGGRKRRHTRR